jgi:RNA polymerase sigma-70 factor (ECF subfamily)
MDSADWAAEQFEAHRTHLRAVAFRMLGSASEADDAVQESWLRFGRTDTSDVENLGGWLTAVVARVCLDMLRSRRSRREESLDLTSHDPISDRANGVDPEQQAVLADSVGIALLVVLETLAPAERLAFVLHDMFDLPFDEIAPIVGRSPAATRQLASRGRRRVQGADIEPTADTNRKREVVDAFLAASRRGDFEALVALLDPDVVLRADAAAVGYGASPEVRGPLAVAGTFSGRAQAARSALVDGVPGAVWSRGGRPQVVFEFTISAGRIVAIDLLSDAESLAALDVVFTNSKQSAR